MLHQRNCFINFGSAHLSCGLNAKYNRAHKMYSAPRLHESPALVPGTEMSSGYTISLGRDCQVPLLIGDFGELSGSLSLTWHYVPEKVSVPEDLVSLCSSVSRPQHKTRKSVNLEM
ncbi:hypothetical protein HZ326_8661 [Fusarium oxysporum f. sp. albedinis]|nr:hypothetical protein HZ326_8661 [Fusarium oxysporum f. sp. albedinis]